jgi:hypothetical protein
MRELWSVNALSVEFGPDRRTIAKWLDRAGVKPAGDGPKGPVYSLRDAVAALANAPGCLLGDTERASRWNTYYYQALAAREYAGRLLRVLKKRLSEDALRAIREELAAELFHYVAECDALMRGKKFKRGEAPQWSGMGDADLVRALRSLIEAGALEEEGAP